MTLADSAQIRETSEKFGPERLIRIDHAPWLGIQGKSSYEEGTKNVPLAVKGNEKTCITVVGIIWMSGAKLPLIYVLTRVIECM
jgi:hypothetical protein